MDKSNMIDVTGVDLREVVRHAYELSQPQGLGHLHYIPGPLSEDEVTKLLEGRNPRAAELYPVNLDYVKGRAVKLSITNEDGKLWMRDRWYDHSDYQLRELLQRVGRPDLCDKVASPVLADRPGYGHG